VSVPKTNKGEQLPALAEDFCCSAYALKCTVSATFSKSALQSALQIGAFLQNLCNWLLLLCVEFQEENDWIFNSLLI
tara:strand:+ start:1958 stop:2188 length:231 start_codon:yes stop_codon:yes gene_type:complete